ncbi:MAG: CHAT domain-containing protein [bacterium]
MSRKNILELVYHEEGKIRLSLYESHGEGPISFYQESEIAIEKIDGLVLEIIRYLNKINLFKNPDQHLLTELQKSCQLLYNELLSQEIKLQLQNTSLKDLELILDEQLVHIPWELLFDGQKFLCEQFNMGRQVRTKGDKVIRSDKDEPKSQLSMLIIADPTEDLEIAWREGVRIYEEFQQKEDLVKIMLQTSDQVDLDFIKKNLWDYDLVHYAGHADYNSHQPNLSGWMFSDGKLNTIDILKMAGGRTVMPRLVFCNACQSGYTGKWLKEKDHLNLAHHSFGLVHAFLMAGVKYYLGTFCDVSDEYSAYMGIEFYHFLLEGDTIGQSLRKARESFKEKFGESSFCWINYVLYGHPGDYLIRSKGVESVQQEHESDISSEHYEARIGLVHRSSESKAAAHSMRHLPFSFPGRDRWLGIVIIFLLFLVFTTLAFFFPRRHVRNDSNKENGNLIISQYKTKRIEELKGIIYQKLKERQERSSSVRTPPLPADRWTSTPVVIAIFDIVDIDTDPLPEWALRMIRDLGIKLTGHFIEDRRVRVAEREELDKLLEEKDLKLSDFSFDDQKDIFGRFLYAGIMLFLKGYKSAEGLSLCYKVVDTETGEIDKIDSGIQLAKRVKSKDLAASIYLQAKEVIYAKYPLRGKIVMGQENRIFLNIGAESGVKKGDIFAVFGSDTQGIKGEQIGKLRIMGDPIDPASAQCEVLEGEGFSSGLRVEICQM